MKLTWDQIAAAREAAQSVVDRLVDELYVHFRIFDRNRAEELDIPFSEADEAVIKSLLAIEIMTQINASDEVKARTKGNDDGEN